MSPFSMWLPLCARSALFLLVVVSRGTRGDELMLLSQPVLLNADDQLELVVAAVNCSSISNENITVSCRSTDRRVFDCQRAHFTARCGYNSSLVVLGVAIGLANLTLKLDNESLWTYAVSVTRHKATAVDSAFTYGLIVLLSLGIMGFGASLDIKVMRERLRKPKSLLIGVACQFTIMPTISFALCRIASLPTPLALGVFASGCSPSGGGSNVWTKLLDGDVDLSVVLTFIINIGSFAMMPLWFYTLGQLLSDGTPIVIPYLDMLRTLAVSIVPLLIGVIVAKFLPKVGRIMVKAIMPLAVTFLLYVFTFGMYANFYIFEVIGREPRVWIVLLLPFAGLTLAGLVAFAARESRPSCIAIAVETTIQSTGTAIILLRLSLDQPWSDMSLCVPILVSIFTPLPLLAFYIGKVIWKKIRQRSGNEGTENEKTNFAYAGDSGVSLEKEVTDADLPSLGAEDASAAHEVTSSAPEDRKGSSGSISCYVSTV